MDATVEKVKCYRKNVEIQYTSVVTPVIASPWRVRSIQQFHFTRQDL